MVRLTQSDKTGQYGWDNTVTYFETIDEAIAAIPDFDQIPILEEGNYAGQLRYQYEVRYYEDITLDHDLIVKDKTFNIAANSPEYDAKLSFTDGHSMILSRDTIDNRNSVELYQIHNIGNIMLGKTHFLPPTTKPLIN